MSRNKINRRDFLRWSTSAAVGAVLAGCTPAAKTHLPETSGQPAGTIPVTDSPLPIILPTPTESAIARPPERPFKELAAGRHLGIATRMDYFERMKDPKLQGTILREMDRCSLGYEMDWEYLYYKEGEVWIGQLDEQVDFAGKNNLALTSGSLVWWMNLPPWLAHRDSNGQLATDFNRQELLTLLDNHFKTIVGKYAGKFANWYVLNELIETNWSQAAGCRTRMRESIWYNVIGPEYIEHSLRQVHSIDPSAKLFINEALNWGPFPSVAQERADLFYNLVVDLLDRGVPIHGIGEQMHLQTDYSGHQYQLDLALYENLLKRFMDLGLEVHITEADVAIRGEVTEASLQKQAERYRWGLDLAMRYEKVTQYTIWGLSDRNSYVKNFDPDLRSEFIMDENYNPKPAYFALKDCLKG